MKKSLIVMHRSLYVGGIETSLINLVNNINNNFDLKVVLLAEGTRTDQLKCEYETVGIDSIVNRYQRYYSEQMKNTNSLIEKIKIFSTKVLARLNLMDGFIVKKIKKEFHSDIGICFSCEEGLIKAYKKCIKSKFNICFVHFDVSKNLDLDNPEEKLKFFDKIICVSKGCAEIFKNQYPLLAEKVDYVYNILDNEHVRNLSTAFDVEYSDKFNIVSVARMSEEKGFPRMLNALAELKERGYDFCWNIVGDAECPEKSKLLNMISNKNMEKYVKFWGEQTNPYPYIKKADLLLLGSYYESWGLVLIESMLVETPVLTTRTCASDETVGDKGYICDNNQEALTKQLQEIFDNKKDLEEKRKNLKIYNFDNKKIIEKFVNICKEVENGRG